MEYPELSRGDKNEFVLRIQTWLNKVGAMLIADGDFGAATEQAVRYVQDIAGQDNTGTVDKSLWTWLESKPEPFPPLATNGVAFIALEETGGLAYYDDVSRFPHYPGEASGITLGVGYDLRFHSENQFRNDWGDHLSQAVLDELSKDIGQKGTKKRVKVLKNLGIDIPFKFAWPVFIKTLLPNHYSKTEGIYQSLPRLPDLCRSVLVSLVYNRGVKLSGGTRTEMKNIQTILIEADNPDFHKQKIKMILGDVEDQILSMKRLWDMDSGLVKRRQMEANIWRKGLQDW